MNVPLCKHCRHVGTRFGGGAFCTRPISESFSPVEGRVIHHQSIRCARERSRDKSLFFRQPMCGPAGKFFERDDRGPPPSQRGD